MLKKETPLAELCRPSSFDDFIGIGQIDSSFVEFCKKGEKLPPSTVIYGPPGSGKTTLARLIAKSFDTEFVEVSAVLQGVADIRKIFKKAEESDNALILFVDEIHRFNKSQQDSFLPFIENGTIILIGATTENPSFYLNQALLSRTTLIKLDALKEKDLEILLNKILNKLDLIYLDDIKIAILNSSGKDARQLISTVSNLNSLYGNSLTKEELKTYLSKKQSYHYDRAGDNHYQCISAFIKSLRGSNPDAALYWGLHMLEAGEDPRFLFRRMLIFASEDIGNADPRALMLAESGARAFEQVGMPEGRIVFSQVVTYLATAPKSNRSYVAVNKALSYVKKNPYKDVPMHLRNADTKIMKDLGYGKNYKYAHNYDFGYAPNQTYFPDNVEPVTFYEPSTLGAEKTIFERLKFWKNLKEWK